MDPETASRTQTERTLSDAGFEPAGVASLAAAHELLDGEESIDCLVTEQRLADGSGLELVKYVRETSPDTACILFTDVGLEAIDTEAFGDVVAEYVSKDDPDARTALLDLVEQSLAFQSQTAYPLPEQEDARLAALNQYAVDGEALGSSLDRLSALATELFGVNAAAVGLVDSHEERFLSCHGISFEPVDREETVCTYAILDDGVTVIEDVLADARFAENEGLAAADIRFYAGAQLRSPDGQPIGTFCLYDESPRSFSDRDRELLQLLADEAMDQLVLRRRLREAGGETDD